MPRKQSACAAPAPVADDNPLLAEINRRFDALANLLLRGEPYDWVELEAVRKKRAELLGALEC
jgi:hypothetical protein